MMQGAEAGTAKRSRNAWAARTGAQKVRQCRGVKRRVEFSLPDSVLSSMELIAQSEGKSVTTLLLETLQRGDERLGIGPIHFVDLRRRLPVEATDVLLSAASRQGGC